MILVPCPNCGLRNASEFRWCGELQPRPDSNRASPEQWRDYLYLKSNSAGWITETWYHREGCGRYFRTERHTLTNEIRVTRGVGRQESAAAETGTDASGRR